MGKNTRVMVVDDEGINLSIVEEALTSNGYAAICTEEPDKALQIAIEEMPDFIVLDIVMPQKSGIDLCRDLKLNPATRHIPIILLTGSTESEHIIASLHLGAIDYLKKPLESNKLIEVIFRHDMVHKIHKSMDEAKKVLKDIVKRY